MTSAIFCIINQILSDLNMFALF